MPCSRRRGMKSPRHHARNFPGQSKHHSQDPQRKRQGARYRTHGAATAAGACAARSPRSTPIADASKSCSRAIPTSPRSGEVLEILTDEGFTGGYTGVKEHMRCARPAPKPTPSLEAPVFRPRRDGRESDLVALRAHLHRSTQRDRAALRVRPWSSPQRKFFDVFGSVRPLRLDGVGHVRAFARFRGCASPGRASTRQPEAGRARLGRTAADLQSSVSRLRRADAHGIRPAAVRGKPNAKPRVERSFWEAERSFLNGRSFRDRDDFRAQLAVWLDRVVDPRKQHHGPGVRSTIAFKTKPPICSRCFTHPYDTARVTYRHTPASTATSSGSAIATPFPMTTSPTFLALRVTQTELFIYGPDIACLARYELRPRRTRPKRSTRSACTLAPIAEAVIDGDKLRAAFADMGDGACVPPPTHHAFPPASGPITPESRSCSCRARYNTADVVAALARTRRCLRRPRGGPRSNASSPAGIDRARSTNTSPRTPHSASTTPSDPASPRRAISPNTTRFHSPPALPFPQGA